MATVGVPAAEAHSVAAFAGDHAREAQSDSARSLEEEREKHRQRAARFGTDYLEPEQQRKDRQAEPLRQRRAAPRPRPERRPGFATGLDVFSEEEIARRSARAQRFDTAGQGIDYRPMEREDAEDVEKKRKRAARFGTEYVAPDETGMMDVDLLEARMEAAAEVARRPDAVHLYGVDLLSTAECLGYFEGYGPTCVEWLDDSSCNVLFGDAGSAARAIAGRGRPLPPDGAAPDHAGLDPTDPRNMPRLWHKGEDFVKGGTPVPLLFRMATVADVKPPKGTKMSRFLWKAAPSRKAQKMQTQRMRQWEADVDMEEAEAVWVDDGSAEEAEEEEAAPAVPRADVADARELLSRPAEDLALFSAEAAGVQPPGLAARVSPDEVAAG